jgi:hypothetical protein
MTDQEIPLYISEILLRDPSRGTWITWPLPCEEEGGWHLRFLVVGISDSAASWERGDDDSGGDHWWWSRGYAGGARRRRGHRFGLAAAVATTPTIEVRVWGYLGVTTATTSGDKSGYRRFLGAVGDRRRTVARRRGHHLSRGWLGTAGRARGVELSVWRRRRRRRELRARVLMPKHVIKYEHTLVRFTTQQLMLLVVRTGLIDRDNRSDRYGEDQRVGARIMITITLSWWRMVWFMSKPTKR